MLDPLFMKVNLCYFIATFLTVHIPPYHMLNHMFTCWLKSSSVWMMKWVHFFIVNYEFLSRGLHGSKNSCPNPKETRNVLHRTDPDPSIISKARPGPVQIREMPNRTRPGPVYYLKAGPETAGKTQTRLDPIVTYSTLNCYYKSINLLRKIQLFVLPNLRSRSSVS